MSLTARPGPGVAAPTPAAPHILVVDDDEYVYTAIVAVLRPLRANVSRAATAAEALAIARSQVPDLAIVDLGLPDADGYELTRLLRSEPGLCNLRIVIVTGYDPDENAARTGGADLIIGKPFRLHDFLEKVTGQLQRGAALV